jgi:intermediate cleaving peptidase 55
VYEAVLRTQKHIISVILVKLKLKLCREELHISLNDLQRETAKRLRDECGRLFGRHISHAESEILYPHHVGHWIGLDLHDTHSISKNIKLKKGMALTVEPGLYIPDSLDFPEAFRGIGVRIEDDIVVGDDKSGGPIVLTAEAPKEVDDIEAVMSGAIKTL